MLFQQVPYKQTRFVSCKKNLTFLEKELMLLYKDPYVFINRMLLSPE